MTQPLTFRSARIVYYGPHECSNCSVLIAKMGPEWGGTAFTYPKGPIYPNTVWNPHVCDPFEVREFEGRKAREQQLKAWPSAHPVKVKEIGYVIASGSTAIEKTHVISPHCNFYDTELAAWSGAQERQDKNYPTWWMDSRTGAILSICVDRGENPNEDPIVVQSLVDEKRPNINGAMHGAVPYVFPE